MILPIALIIFLNGFVMLTLAEPISSDNGQQRLTAQFGDVPSSTRFPIFNLSEQMSQRSPLKNFKVTSHARNEASINDIETTNISRTDAFKEVSEILFSDLPHQRKVLELLLHDIQRGNHLLLVEKRGLENKKVADRLLQHLNRPTEYTQLHGNTTIQALTVQPIFKNGTVIYEDSPLVKAVKYGYVLVVDEADKASTEVSYNLNHLMESGEMDLSDGRRIISKEIMNSSGSKSERFIPMHKDFRMILMASRYGYPFYENDDYGPSVSNMGVIGTTVRAVGSRPTITTAVMGDHGTGPHTATAIASGTSVATATALTYGRGSSTATAIASGNSRATATSRSYDEGDATSTAITSGSVSVNAEANARGNQHIDDIQIKS